MVITLAVLSLVTFLATSAVPSDPARAALGKGASQVQIDEFRAQQGLDQPVLERYVTWLGGFLSGDWGDSLVNKQPVRQEVTDRLGRTIVLALIAFAIALPIGIGLGLYSGRRIGKRSDRAIGSATFLVVGMPEFVIGILLLAVFGVWLAWLPVDSSAIALEGTSLLSLGEAFVLPALALVLTVVPYLLRMMRANTRDVVSEPYVRAATLRGVTGRRLGLRHILPNALAPVVNVLSLNFAELIAGVVAIEAVFGFPGAGQLLVASVQSQDIPMVQALVLVIGAFFVGLNLIADLALVALNPRLRS